MRLPLDVLLPAVLTATLVAAPPALRPLAAKGTTRALSGALSLQPTIPVIPANLNMRGMAQSGVPASAELRMSAATFTPGEKEHKTPIKTTGATAADEDEELCAWLQQKASLTQRVVQKALPKLHGEDVYDVEGLLALHSINGLSDVFSRVVAVQVANALDGLTIGNGEPAQPAGLTTPRPRAASTTGAGHPSAQHRFRHRSRLPPARGCGSERHNGDNEPARTNSCNGRGWQPAGRGSGAGRTPYYTVQQKAGRCPPTPHRSENIRSSASAEPFLAASWGLPQGSTFPGIVPGV